MRATKNICLIFFVILTNYGVSFSQNIEYLEDTTRIDEWAKYYYDQDELKAVRLNLVDTSLQVVFFYENDSLSKLSYYCDQSFTIGRKFENSKLISFYLTDLCMYICTRYSDSSYWDIFKINSLSIKLTYSSVDHSLLNIMWMDIEKYKLIIYDFNKKGVIKRS